MPHRDRAAIQRAIDRMSADPSSVDLAKLSGDQWRVRVGRWRIIVELDNHDGLIIVTSVLARKDADRD